MKRCIVVFSLIAMAGCAVLREKHARTVKIRGTISVERPVCGDQPAKGDVVPVAEATYYIKNGTANHPDSVVFEQLDTDAAGNFTVFLAPGDYAVIHKDKLMSFGEFRLKHSQTSNYFRLRDEDCFRRWYDAADFVLHVENDTTVSWLVKSRCYTQTNPCIEYTGPK